MTPRQFAVLQRLAENGWTTPLVLSAIGVDGRALTLLAKRGLIERATRRLVGTRKPVDVAGWQITDAGEAALVAENLRLLKEVTR